MLILQKADLFDVRFGFKINAIKNIFAEEYEAYAQEMAIAEDMAELEVQELLERARADCLSIYNSLQEMDMAKGSARPQLDRIGRMFNVYIDFDVVHDVDITIYPDSEKIGVWGMGINQLYPQAEAVDYYDGE